MVFKATINELEVMLVHPNYPRNCCAKALYLFPLWFLNEAYFFTDQLVEVEGNSVTETPKNKIGDLNLPASQYQRKHQPQKFLENNNSRIGIVSRSGIG